MIYLDHAATTPMRPQVWAAMEPFAGDEFGNPSGIHAVARRAKNALEEARERVAGALGAAPGEIVFTSGGTESDNQALIGRALHRRGSVVTTAIEHEAVLEAARFCGRMGCRVTSVAPDRDGVVDPERLVAAVDADTAVVSVMTANNETGAVQPVRQVVEALGGSVPVHTDAVQAFATEPVTVDGLGIDLLSLSAHKFGGPKGVGVLYVRRGTELEPLVLGGGQEMGRRSGTVDVMGAVGLATAVELAVVERSRVRETVTAARRAFEAVVGERVVRTVEEPSSLAQHLHVSIPAARNETLLVALDRAGVAASAASSCQSGATTVSHVLTAMGLTPDEARRCLRFSFGWTSTVDEARRAARLLVEALEAAA